MKKLIPVLCSAVVCTPLLASAAGAATINPFTNGDFETGTLTPWVATPGANNDQIQVAPTVLLLTIGAGSLTTDGNFVVDFNGNNSAPGGTLSQTFATIPGTTYAVGFQYGSTTGGPEKLDASVAGVGGASDVLSSLSATASSPPVALTTSTFNFTADGTSATLAFLDDPTNPTVNVDGVLDNVTVTTVATAPVPEPATAGLLALVGSGLLARRKSRRS